LLDLEEMGIRSYASEPGRGRQKWDGRADARDAVYANRRRVKGGRGRRLLRGRGEKLERTFAHCYETGGMRRLHLRGRDNIAKRVLAHAAGFNMGLLMRVSYGLRKPRSLSAAAAMACTLIFALVRWLGWMAAAARAIRPAAPLRQIADRGDPTLSAA
jgi:transposase